jgi:hypothetical protein
MRIAKRGAISEAHRCTAALDLSYERLAQKLRRGGNSEVFFAAKAILCEGQDDVAAVRALLDRRAIDPDAINTSVLDCGGPAQGGQAGQAPPPRRRTRLPPEGRCRAARRYAAIDRLSDGSSRVCKQSAG